MIVPDSRLLILTGGVAVPAATLLGMAPSLALPMGTCLFLCLLAALADIMLSVRLLESVEVRFSPLARMSRGRKHHLELFLRNKHGRPRQLRMALAFPPEIHTAQTILGVQLPEGPDWRKFAWPCRGMKRGLFRVEHGVMEERSRLGLWQIRRPFPAGVEIRVYPSLLEERRNLAGIFLNRAGVGVHAQRMVGQGREFEKVREYIFGDSYEDIHWKATAKRAMPVTKVFQLERTQEIYVILDSSRLSGRPEMRVASPSSLPGNPHAAAESEAGTVQLPVLERFITAALILGLVAEKQGDLFGVMSFSNRVDRFVRAKSGRAHFNACREALYNLEPRLVPPDYEELLTFIRLNLRRRALLLFLTDLDDPPHAESLLRVLRVISRQHLVIVNSPRQPLVQRIFTGEPAGSLDGIYQRLAGHLQWRQLEEVGKKLQRQGVKFLLVENEKLSAELVSQYMSVKQRQLL